MVETLESMGVTEAMERQAVDFSKALLFFGCVNDARTVRTCLQRYREVVENKDNAVPLKTSTGGSQPATAPQSTTLSKFEIGLLQGPSIL